MLREFCTAMFRATGWKFVNNVPDELRSFVFIGAPHTSNYDFIPAMAVSYLMKRNARFAIKNDWLKFPFKFFLVQAGAVGIDRKKLNKVKSTSAVEVLANLFSDFEELVLLISPEGTRSPNENWKTGFYHIAQKAQVPLVLGFCDYDKKEAGLGMVIYPTNFAEDMKTITKFYENIQGKNPENFKLDSKSL